MRSIVTLKILNSIHFQDLLEEGDVNLLTV